MEVRTLRACPRGVVCEGLIGVRDAEQVHYDPGSLAEPGTKRAVLHAKCVVADDTRAFVTSANFTEAAQQRNIEVGVLLHDAEVARSLVAKFEQFVAGGHLMSVPSL